MSVFAASLDMHRHPTEQMMTADDVIVALKESSHTDFLGSGQKLGVLCGDLVIGDRQTPIKYGGSGDCYVVDSAW